MVSDEHDHFFSRPALMYVFAGQMRLRDTEPYDRRPLRAHGLRARARPRDGARSRPAGRLSFEDGGSLGYDRLLLAVGSQGRPAPWPGSRRPGPALFRHVRRPRAASTARRFRACVRSWSVVGLIGVEVAEILHDRGLRVSVRDPGELVLSRSRSTARVRDRRRARARSRHRRPARRRSSGGRPRGGRAAAGGRRRARAGHRRRRAGLDRGRPRGLGDRRRATHRLPGRQRGLARRKRRDRDRRRPAHVGARRVGGRRLRERDDPGRRSRRWSSSGTRRASRAASRRARCSATRSSTGAARRSTRPSSSTSSGRRRLRARGDRSRAGRRSGARGGALVPACSRPPRQPAVVVQDDRVVGFNMLGSRWDHEAFVRWIEEDARSPGCSRTSRRRSSTRSSRDASASRREEAAQSPRRGSDMQAGLLHTYHNAPGNRSWPAWALSALLFAAYALLYFGAIPALGLRFDPLQASAESIGAALGPAAGAAQQVDPVRCRLHAARCWRAAPSSCAATATAATSRVRTITVVLVQVLLAFALAAGARGLRPEEYYFSYFWPLKIEYLYPSVILQQPFLIVALERRGLAGRVPAARLLLRQALLLLVGLRLRRARQHGRRAVPPPLAASRRARGRWRRSRSTRCCSSRC